MVPKHAKFNQIRILTLGNDFGIHPGLFLSSHKSFEHGDLLVFTTLGYFEAKMPILTNFFGVLGLCSSDSHLPFPVPFMFMNPRNGSVTIGMIKTVSRRCAVKENQKNAIFHIFLGFSGKNGIFFPFFQHMTLWRPASGTLNVTNMFIGFPDMHKACIATWSWPFPQGHEDKKKSKCYHLPPKQPKWGGKWHFFLT